MRKHYVIVHGKVVRTNPFCPRCGRGVLMADKGEWWSCGKCGDRYRKEPFDFQHVITTTHKLFQEGVSSNEV